MKEPLLFSPLIISHFLRNFYVTFQHVYFSIKKMYTFLLRDTTETDEGSVVMHKVVGCKLYLYFNIRRLYYDKPQVIQQSAVNLYTQSSANQYTYTYTELKIFDSSAIICCQETSIFTWKLYLLAHLIIHISPGEHTALSHVSMYTVWLCIAPSIIIHWKLPLKYLKYSERSKLHMSDNDNELITISRML